MAQEKQKLAMIILSKHFGPIVAAVGEVLASNIRQTDATIIEKTKLPRDKVAEALVVGIVHNFITFETTASINKPSGTETYYAIDLDNVIIRLRFAKLVQIAKDKYGDHAELIIEELLSIGTCKLAKLIEVCKGIRKSIMEQHYNEEQEINEFNEILAHLKRQRFIVKVGEPKKEEATDKKADKKKTPKKAASKKRKREPKTTTPKKRAKKTKKKTSKDLDENDDHIAPEMRFANLLNPDAPQPPETVVRSAPKTVTFPAPNAVVDDSEWRVNYPRFSYECCIQHCIRWVQRRLDSRSARIIRGMFDVIEKEGGNAKSTVVSDKKIYKAVRDNDASRQDSKPVTLSGVQHYLSIMASDVTRIVLGQPAVNDSKQYTVNISGMAAHIRIGVVESVVRNKFGIRSLRLFRLIRDKKYIEQTQVADLAMIPVQECRVFLFKMLHAGYLHLQEVPKSKDHSTNRTFFLWTVKLPEVQLLVLAEVYRAIKNLKLRSEHELEEMTELNHKAEAAHHSDAVKLTEEEVELVQNAEFCQQNIENAILGLDETLMTLRDYPS